MSFLTAASERSSSGVSRASSASFSGASIFCGIPLVLLATNLSTAFAEPARGPAPLLYHKNDKRYMRCHAKNRFEKIKDLGSCLSNDRKRRAGPAKPRHRYKN